MRSASNWALAVFVGALCFAAAGSFSRLCAREHSSAGSRSDAMPGSARYFVEFRAAEIGVYGHSYIMYGRLNARGQPSGVHYADFHPKGGFTALALGHLVPVEGSYDPDPETMTLPLDAVYRRILDAPTYARLLAAVAEERRNHSVWSAEFYNCTSFIVNVAHAIGLKTPPVMLLSAPTVKLIRSMNES